MARGRDAQFPSEIPPAGLLDVGWRVVVKQASNSVGLLAAGIAFYGLLSLFPGIAALVAIGGIMIDPQMLVSTIQPALSPLPTAASDIIMGQLEEVAGAEDSTLSIAAIASLLIALYSASRVTENFIIGLNAVYEEEETRGIIKLTLLKIAITLTMLFGILLCLFFVAALPGLFAWFGLGALAQAAEIIRWPILLGLAIAGITMLYRFGPDRRSAKWRWLTPGALLACVLWVAGSFGFSAYVQAFGSYNETFGALGGVIILLTWLWLSAFIVLLGAQTDAELEAQTAKDSTYGEDLPMGERGAFKADNLGKLRGSDKAAATPAE